MEDEESIFDDDEELDLIDDDLGLEDDAAEPPSKKRKLG